MARDTGPPLRNRDIDPQYLPALQYETGTIGKTRFVVLLRVCSTQAPLSITAPAILTVVPVFYRKVLGQGVRACLEACVQACVCLKACVRGVPYGWSSLRGSFVTRGGRRGGYGVCSTYCSVDYVLYLC